MKRLFITASGTETGKSYVASLLIRQLRARGKKVRALKPLITGFTDATARQSDTCCLLDALGLPMSDETIASVSPWRFAAPLSPNMAASREARQINLKEVVAFCRAARNGPEDYLLIEGVGGVLVPLDDQYTVREWIMILQMPALLVTGSYLGSISHTLTALEALQSKGVPVTGIVVSESHASTAPFAETLETLARFSGGVRIQGLARNADIGNAPDLTYLIDPAF
ncbi:MAG TPA: dethiobiotin synthase [Alphaproteobacteria bacterium]|nr:dethiobiotin synthase [Alphaproteobacteria bacterium]